MVREELVGIIFNILQVVENFERTAYGDNQS